MTAVRTLACFSAQRVCCSSMLQLLCGCAALRSAQPTPCLLLCLLHSACLLSTCPPPSLCLCAATSSPGAMTLHLSTTSTLLLPSTSFASPHACVTSALPGLERGRFQCVDATDAWKSGKCVYETLQSRWKVLFCLMCVKPIRLWSGVAK